MQGTPGQVAERAVSTAATMAEICAESWGRHYEHKRAKAAPEAPESSGFAWRVRQECFRAIMYGTIAYMAQAMKESRHPVDVGAARVAIQAALFKVPEDVAGAAGETRERIGRYHAAWRQDRTRLQAEIVRSVREASGLAGTPHEALVNEVSEAAACDWIDQGLDVLKQALPR